MAIEAPISKFKKNGLKIYIAICIAVAIIFAYDGYLSKYKWSMRYNFYKKHVVDNDGKPTSTMNFNRKSPLFFIGFTVLLGAYLFAIKNRKIVADENELIINNKLKIPYDSIERLDKTYFSSKGFFKITYKVQSGAEVNRKLRKKDYDNLQEIMDLLEKEVRGPGTNGE